MQERLERGVQTAVSSDAGCSSRPPTTSACFTASRHRGFTVSLSRRRIARPGGLSQISTSF